MTGTVTLTTLLLLLLIAAVRSDIPAHQYCSGCVATLMQIEKLIGRRRITPENRAAKVNEMVGGMCTTDNFMKYKYSPPKIVKACEKLMAAHRSDVEHVFSQSTPQLTAEERRVKICHHISAACEDDQPVDVLMEKGVHSDLDLSSKDGDQEILSKTIEYDPSTGKVKTKTTTEIPAKEGNQAATASEQDSTDEEKVVVKPKDVPPPTTKDTTSKKEDSKKRKQRESAERLCVACIASVTELDKLLKGKRRKTKSNWNVKVMEAMDNLCEEGTFGNYRYAPPAMVRACKLLMSEHEETIEEAYEQDKPNRHQLLCTSLCKGFDMATVANGESPPEGRTLSKQPKKKKKKGEAKMKENKKAEAKKDGGKKGSIHNLNLDVNDPNSMKKVMEQIEKIKQEL